MKRQFKGICTVSFNVIRSVTLAQMAASMKCVKNAFKNICGS